MRGRCGTAGLDGSLATCAKIELQQCNDGRLEPAQGRDQSQRGDVCVPHMVLPTDLGYVALAFHRLCTKKQTKLLQETSYTSY